MASRCRPIVPSWYAVASVKWLTDIELIGQPFAGHFQMKKYCYEWRRGSEDAREPVTRMQVRARITDSGPAMLRARATDCAGRVQPDHAQWNRLGYGNNSIQEIAIRVI